jgi:LDH2 family malate/lactate/ureidoglycolate dehydrogenase
MNVAQAEDLQRFAARVFVAHGAAAADANTVASALIKASLLGHDSHGVLRIGRYVDKIRKGTLHPAAQPSFHRRHGATATIDGAFGFGQLAGALGADLAIEIARTHGVAAVALSRTNHLGRVGDYAERISAAGFFALIFASGAGPGGSVAPHGGCERIFGTNPLAWSLPVPPGRGPLVADFSTSAIPEGLVAMAQAREKPLPAGAVLARDGRPTLDPADYYAGGALLPFGGHKGSSLVLLIELVASLLAGSVPASSAEYQPGNPAVIIALDVAAFLPLPDFLRHTEALLCRIESSTPASGAARVLTPNAVEMETAVRRQRYGIPVPVALWTELQALGRDANVPWPA